MRLNASRLRLLVATIACTVAAVVALPMLVTPAQACGPYGTPSASDQAYWVAAAEHYERDQTRFVFSHRVRLDGDRARVRLLLQDEEAGSFDRIVHLERDDDGWVVTRMGAIRPLRRTA